MALGEVSARVLTNTDKGHTLDIVVEGAVLLPVFPQEPEGVVVPKVLKLDESVLAIPTAEGRDRGTGQSLHVIHYLGEQAVLSGPSSSAPAHR